MSINAPSEPRHMVAVFGGAVAGSEATRVLADAGCSVIVFEQNARPYGKIEDGLPRWHDKQRAKEYTKLDAKIDRDNVEFVPNTVLGKDISWADIQTWGFSAILLAVGAWRDRSIDVEGINEWVGKGLEYQNPVVYWFNHYPESTYDGPTYEIPDDTLIVGGGLASIDVAKICMLETVKKALKEKFDKDVCQVEMEHKGIKKTLENLGIAWEDLGLKGCRLMYRRRPKDMPLLAAPKDADEARMEKVFATREKLLNKVVDEFYVNFIERRLSKAPIIENDRIVGLHVIETRIEGRKVIPLEDNKFEIRAPLIIGSIGSVPAKIEGIEMRGEYYKYKDWDTGEMDGYTGVYGVGNTVTGQGNIRLSLKHGTFVGQHVLEKYLCPSGGELDEDNLMAGAEAKAEGKAEAIAEKIAGQPKLSVEAQSAILAKSQARQAEVGYEGYQTWLRKVSPPEMFETH